MTLVVVTLGFIAADGRFGTFSKILHVSLHSTLVAGKTLFIITIKDVLSILDKFHEKVTCIPYLFKHLLTITCNCKIIKSQVYNFL